MSVRELHEKCIRDVREEAMRCSDVVVKQRLLILAGYLEESLPKGV